MGRMPGTVSPLRSNEGLAVFKAVFLPNNSIQRTPSGAADRARLESADSVGHVCKNLGMGPI